MHINNTTLSMLAGTLLAFGMLSWAADRWPNGILNHVPANVTLPDIQPGECSDLGLAKGHEAMAALASLAIEENLTIVGSEGSCGRLDLEEIHKKHFSKILMRDMKSESPNAICTILNVLPGTNNRFMARARIKCVNEYSLNDDEYVVGYLFTHMAVDNNGEMIVAFVIAIE